MKKVRKEVDNQIFRELFFASPIAGYLCDKDGFLKAYNPAAISLWERQPEIGKERWSGAFAIFYVDGRPMPAEKSPMAMVLAGKEDRTGEELVIQRPDGTQRIVLVFPKLIYAATGDLIGVYTALVDITEYKQYEEKQAMLSEIVQSSDDAIVSKNLEGIIMSWNTGAERIFGYSEQEIIGKSINTLIPNYLRTEEETIIREIKAGRKVDHYQTIRRTKSGKEIPISLTISPMRNKQGQVIGASKIARDISDKIQREQTIQFHAQKLETLHAIGKVISEKLDTPSIIQTVIDSTTHLASADVGLCFYRVSDELGSSKLSVSVAAHGNGGDYDNLHLDEGIIHTIFAGENVVKFDDVCEAAHILSLFNTKEGAKAPRIRHCLAIPIRAADKLLIGAMFFGYAQAEVFKTADEDMMRNIASLVAVTLDNARLFEEVNALNLKKNEFIALASHELKTPLTTIKGYLQILERSEIDQVGRRFLTKALKQLERINALIAELLDISKIEAGKLSFHFERFDMSEMVLDVVETFHFSSQTHTIFVNNIHGDYTVIADRQRMEQVIINLITNAIKYSPNANNVYVTLESSLREVSVQVKDEGMGMSRDQQEKVFTRFYQVEGTSKMTGLGLGLYLSKEIIERHGGHIGVNSQLGQGSTFYFSIPREQEL
ncbi:PAS domain-containing sensor histidine kinase [Parapedobacter koreensis]|uniref:histidine kinase n=1 Tax=Parapedobacter koreensis TaxID=332977 RepID=A0A1H7P0C6_9SPHI|nr:PAS domain S-box protein [Parapedobacter koreensis]SEL28695.1 PAS domain S-box-containing protein [Parapedobacter koreensis]